MIHSRRSIALPLVIIVLFSLSVWQVSANTVSAEVIVPSVISPGDIIWFDIIVTNLVPLVLDHVDYGFTVSPYVDLIQIPWGQVDASSHMTSFYDSLAAPPSQGTSHFFGDLILGRVRGDALPHTDIISEFWILVVGDVRGPEGEWCYGCWQDYAGSGNITVVGDPLPVPEFPTGGLSALFLACFIAVVSICRGRK